MKPFQRFLVIQQIFLERFDSTIQGIHGCFSGLPFHNLNDGLEDTVLELDQNCWAVVPQREEYLVCCE